MGQELEDRVATLERWRDKVKPFIDQLEGDLTYRRRREGERAHLYSRTARIVATTVAVIVAATAVASFVLQVIHATHGGHQ